MFTPLLLSRVEDAGLNASAPPQQRWVDGWLVRFSPGKAKRARCINAVARGRMSLEEKLRLVAPLFRDAGLPLVLRITPFSEPEGLDRRLADMGMVSLDDTRVMLARLDELPAAKVAPLPVGYCLERSDSVSYAQAVGALRGSPMAQRVAHAERLSLSPVPYQGWLVRSAQGEVVACGQIAAEAELVGLYDVFTTPTARGHGLATALCVHLLNTGVREGATTGYLQVEGNNSAARTVYQRLGFSDAYSYHYRSPDPAAT
jgi:GNAT superfamily N-acetyltransferase